LIISLIPQILVEHVLSCKQSSSNKVLLPDIPNKKANFKPEKTGQGIVRQIYNINRKYGNSKS